MLKGKVFVATPAYRSEVVMHYAHSLVRDCTLAMAGGWFVEAPFFINDTTVHNARNLAVRKFLEGDHDCLVMIDSDLGWEANALLRLLETDGDIVGGVYRKKEDDLSYPFNPLGPIQHPVTPARSVATGFIKIGRECAEETYQAFHGRPFQFEVVDGVEWSEDLNFCNRARSMGFSVAARLDIDFEHVGPHAWSGRPMDTIPAAKDVA